MRKSLTELANNPDLIPGIYNYCDRWCERCPLTARCLVYATENNDPFATENNDVQNNDIRNATFWQRFDETLAEVRQLIPQWAKLALNNSTEQKKVRSHRREVDNHPLTKAGKRYANAASDWFRELDQTSQSTTDPTDRNCHDLQPIEDSREVIQWYQYQIAVKTMRALSSRNEDSEHNNDFPKDSDGSAKVALIGIDRSIAAWRLMQLSLSDHAESIVPLILQLETLRNDLEVSFHQAREFLRPGFDQVPLA
jgi:hypothetical protein